MLEANWKSCAAASSKQAQQNAQNVKRRWVQVSLKNDSKHLKRLITQLASAHWAKWLETLLTSPFCHCLHKWINTWNSWEVERYIHQFSGAITLKKTKTPNAIQTSFTVRQINLILSKNNHVLNCLDKPLNCYYMVYGLRSSPALNSYGGRGCQNCLSMVVHIIKKC